MEPQSGRQGRQSLLGPWFPPFPGVGLAALKKRMADKLTLPAADAAPSELRASRRWCCWRMVWDEAGNKFRKPPVSPVDGSAIGATDKYLDHFVPFEEALAYAQGHGLGVSYVFLQGDGVVGVDFDHCAVDGQVHQEVRDWLRFLPTYQELSPSGTGVHVLLKGKILKAIKGLPLPNAGGVTVEVYASDRHFTFTGQRLNDQGVNDAQAGLDKLIAALGAVNRHEAAADGPPLPASVVRRLHQDQVQALRDAAPGGRNNALNTACYFAARAFAGGALAGTEAEVKGKIWDAARQAWAGEIPLGDQATARTAWASGLKSPLSLAHDEASQALDELNERFFVVGAHGAKCRVAWQDPDPVFDNRLTLSLQSFDDFKNRFDHQQVQVGTKADGTPLMKGKGSYWLRHPQRRTFERIIFDPTKEHDQPDVFNLWNGFVVRPDPLARCDRYLEHLQEVICGGDADLYKWYVGQLAYWAQKPGEPGHVCLVHRGEEGTGKSTAADGYGELWGPHYLTVTKSEQLTGRFNRHLLDCCVCHANEAFYAGAKSHASALKALITDPVQQIEAKGVDLIQAKNRVKLIVSSNEEWVVPAGPLARRFAVFEVQGKRRNDFEHFQRIWKELKGGGQAALLHHLLNLDVSGHNARQAPNTKGLAQQKALTLEGAERVWHELLTRGELPGIKEGKEFTVRTSALLDWAERHKDRRLSCTVQQVGLLLGDNPRGELKGMDLRKKTLPRRWVVPSLGEARRLWDERRGWPGAWHDQPGWEQEEWELTGMSVAVTADDVL